ncbi:Holliday junction DNA helicase, RuvA subunit [Thermanaerovibrio velox DSM 12556]|uniref:Holliday junction branch migration complex subunit RuvA n=1 Tax=Thermanaerovibrio velox DSM 12556 TaxID=926567 RepID=H0URW2_9BACT|nr:Holliday junction branch migration protein RuvA [Thermanaerovibrio velox]EHM10051.1 Holliday junction DNA helicase, RuvA subunit [Thermanaerovibrio velox DSM 12556]
MIRYVEGFVCEVLGDILILEVSGVGIEINATRAVLERALPGERIKVYVYLSVTENGISLYGFHDEDERKLFILLLQVSNVGGKMAMSILRTLRKDELVQAIGAGDPSRIAKAPGVGAKRAERICFELKGKIDQFSFGVMQASESASEVSSLVEALVELGFSRGEAYSALSTVMGRLKGASEEELLMASLRLLGKG